MLDVFDNSTLVYKPAICYNIDLSVMDRTITEHLKPQVSHLTTSNVI